MNEYQKTIISSQTIIRGEISGEEDLSILGQIEGKVNVNGTVFIENSSVVKAELRVIHAVVSGIVIGDIYASDCLEVTADGKILGNIFTPRLILAEGGAIKGKVSMKESGAREFQSKHEKSAGQKASGESKSYGHHASESRISQTSVRSPAISPKTPTSKGFRIQPENIRAKESLKPHVPYEDKKPAGSIKQKEVVSSVEISKNSLEVDVSESVETGATPTEKNEI